MRGHPRQKRDRGIEQAAFPADEATDAAKLDHLLLSRRIESFARASAFTFFPPLASILIVFASFSRIVPIAYLLIGAMGGTAIIFWRYLVARRFDPFASEPAALRRQWLRMNRALVSGSIGWAIAFPIAATFGGGLQHAILGLVGAAILNGVLLAHRYAPKAALIHIVSVSAGLSLATWIVGHTDALVIIGLIVIYALTLIASIRTQETAFVRACRMELLRRDSDHTVRILLNEYETQANDFLWTIDAEGRLQGASARLVELTGIAASELAGRRLLDLLVPGEERDRLADLLARRHPFRDIHVMFASNDGVRWWSLSARARSGGEISGVGRDVTESRAVAQQVQHMAHYDQLTGLANRYLFDKKLTEALQLAEYSRDVALFYLDLDDFKLINDTQGHGVGDRLLSEMGHRLAQEVRGSDLVARLGGDEFAVLMQTAAGDSMLIERAHRFLATAREPFDIDGQEFKVSTSIGIARCEGVGCENGPCPADELMRRADLALYAAKANGRDGFAMFNQTIDTAAQERRRIESEVRDAISGGELRLHYQPIVDLRHGRTTAYEVLVRWQHPSRGLLPPDQFLNVAEDTGLILKLGEWVIRQALLEMSEWDGDFRIAINLSPTQMRDPQLVPTIGEALAQSGIDPRRLELEITENVLIRDGEAGLGTMRRLRELGASVALDDFGTGYSSLSYLRSYPFDRIKIDRNFVEDIVGSAEAQAIVSAITGIADALGIATTAEGIEQAEQIELLRQLGCGEGQGFFIHPPVVADQIGEAHRGPFIQSSGAADSEAPDYGAAHKTSASRGI